MFEIHISASAQALPLRQKRRKPPPILHVYDRRKIMARAWELAREAREEQARRAFDASMTVVAGRITHAKPYSAFFAETRIDLGAAMREAWAEVKGLSLNPEQNSDRQKGRALVLCRRNSSSLAPLRRLRFARVSRLVATAARWIGARFIPSRAA